MADYQRVVEFLRDFRTSATPRLTDEVRQYAAEYAEMCAKANDRLRQCSTFLQQGLRSEAIHLAESAPNLLDMVAALDLPDAQPWVEFCQQYDLPVPPLIQIERATQLNEAYGQDEPAQQLLRHLRRMALARSPIKERLATMRQVAAMDPGSTFWEKDLRAFELIRLRELRQIFSLAIRNRDNRVVAALSRELLESPWLERVPEDLQQAATGAQQQLILIEAEAKLQGLLSQLHDAYAARSHPECTALLEQCKALCAGTERLQAPTQAAAEIKQIMAWVNEENESRERNRAFDEACAQLSNLLAADAPDAQLDAAHARIKEMDEAVPSELENRYQRTLHNRLSSSRRKYWLALASIAAIIILGLLGGYFYMQQNVAKGWAKKIETAIEAKNIALAKQTIEDQEHRAPQCNASPEVQAAKQQTVALEATFKQESDRLGSMLAALAQQQKQAEAVAGADNVPPETLLATVATIDANLRLYANLPKTSWVDPDGKLWTGVERLKSLQSTMQQKAAGAVRASVNALAQDVEKSMSESASADSSALLAKLDDLSRKIDLLRRSNPIDEDSKATLEALAGGIEKKRQAIAQSSDQRQEFRNIRRHLASADDLARTLQAFATRYPDASIIADFTRAIANKSGAKAIEAWRDLAGSFADHPVPATEAIAQQRIQKLRAYLADNPGSPFATPASLYSQYLTQAASALAVTNAWQNAFKDLLTMPLISELKSVGISDGTKYYVLGDIKLVKRRLNESVITSFQAIDPGNLAKPRTIRLNPPLALANEKPELVAHAKFAEKLNAQIRMIDGANWDTFGIDMVDQLVKDTEMDIVVKALLLKSVLAVNQQLIGWAVGTLYEPSLQALTRQDPAGIIWYDPDRPVAASMLQAIRSVIDRIPRADVVRAELEKQKALLFKSLACNIVGSGALMQDDAGAWIIWTDLPGTEGYRAVAAGPASAVVLPPPTTGPTTLPAGAPLIRVATFKGDKYVVDESAIRDLPQGTMLYIVRP